MRRLVRAETVDVAIGVPPLSISGSFRPTDAERLAAWELLVELSSRTSVAPLRDNEGSVREALSSLYSLYDTTRGILRSHGPEVAAPRASGNLSLGVVAMRVLNEILRPVLSTWHPALEAHEAKLEDINKDRTPDDRVSKIEWEREWPDNQACRDDLNRVRIGIRSYIATLGDIAGAADLADAVVALPAARPIAIEPTEKREVPSGIRKSMVRWMSFGELVAIAKSMRGVGGKVADRNTSGAASRQHESETAEAPSLAARTDGDSEPAPAADGERGPVRDEIWFDYVADLGDAFDPTMAVAWQIGRRSIELPSVAHDELPDAPAPISNEPGTGRSLPRASLLVFGGDEVYPYATRAAYDNQLCLPYKLGWEAGDSDEGDENGIDPEVLAIPGNHDWMGGIDEFQRVFLTEQPPRDPTERFAVHWRTTQTDRYWARQLAEGWWLWGIDTGLDNKLDDPQLHYFEQAASQLADGDQVIFCSPVPLWQLRQKHNDDYHLLRSQLARLFPKAATGGPRIRVFLSGDTHFFVHYEGTDPSLPEDHITTGGGGAFLHPTHPVSEQIPSERGRAEFLLTARWPSAADSRSLAPRFRSIVTDRQMIGPAAVIALIHLLVVGLSGAAWFGFGGTTHEGSIFDAMRTVVTGPALAVLAVLVVVGVVTVLPNAKQEPLLKSGARRYGALHGLWLATLFAATAAAMWWLSDWVFDLSGAGRTAFFLVGSFVIGWLIASVFLAGLSAMARRMKVNDNISYSAAHLTRYKHFLRCRVDPTGDLTMYLIGIDPVGHGWADALRSGRVPPPDPAGMPHLHYVWGKTIAGRRPSDPTEPDAVEVGTDPAEVARTT